VTDEVRCFPEQLTGRRRVRAEIPAVDECPGGVRTVQPRHRPRQSARPAHADHPDRARALFPGAQVDR
ncbi:hypothetical protein AB4212_18765, partial [Streptomyces sp. 2MCAF27]